MQHILTGALAVGAMTLGSGAALAHPGHRAENADQSLGRIVGSAKKVADAITVSDEQMQLAFTQLADDMDAKHDVAQGDNPYAVRLARLTDGLESYDGLELDIKAYILDEVNAWAMGDGTVRIYSGLMDAFTDDEVRCVIGHEIAHVKLEHGQKRMRRTLQQDAALSVAGTASNEVSRIADSQLGGLFQSAVYAQYSQKAERRADDYAVQFMFDNGYDAAGCPTAMDKLAVGHQGGGIMELWSTHPSPTKRAKRMRKAIAKQDD